MSLTLFSGIAFLFRRDDGTPVSDNVKDLALLCNGSASLMRGKSPTCRGEPSFLFRSPTSCFAVIDRRV
jgi:hypothetical protein